MAKCCTVIDSQGDLASAGSSGTTVITTKTLKPDGTKVKDTRT